MTVCIRCHRPLKREPGPDGMGPICRRKAVPVSAHERDLFGYDIAKAAEAARFQVHLRIAVMAADASKAVSDRARAARGRLGVRV